MWVPSHVGQADNSAVDLAAKAALLTVPIFRLLYTYTYSGTKTVATKLEFWNSEQAVFD